MTLLQESLQHVSVALQLVAWICDGQRLECQELFREQESQFKVRRAIFQSNLLDTCIQYDLHAIALNYYSVFDSIYLNMLEYAMKVSK